MTTKHIGCSNPRNFKEKIELLKMKEAASTANFAAAMRDAQEICQIACAYDALPLSLDHSHLYGGPSDRSILLKAHSLSDINDSGSHIAKKYSDLSTQDSTLHAKVMPVDRKNTRGSTISSSHTGVHSAVSDTDGDKLDQRVPSTLQNIEIIPIKSNEESKPQAPNVCHFCIIHTHVHDSDYNTSSSWSTVAPFQHSPTKSVPNWSNGCQGVVSQHQIQKFDLYTDAKPHYQSIHHKSHLPANPYLLSASHSDAEVASTSLDASQSLVNSSQYTCESGYFSVSDSIGTPVDFRTFLPINTLQHPKIPFSANFTDQLSCTPTPYPVVDWRRTASDSSIHNSLSGIQLNPTERYTYGAKIEKSHIFNPRPIPSGDHYYRQVCKLKGVEEEENSNILTSVDNNTDTKHACVIRRQRDTHHLDGHNHFIHSELLTTESHVVPAKRPYTCTSDSQSNGFKTDTSQLKICSSHMDSLGGSMDQKSIDGMDTSLKHHKSWKIRSNVYNHPHHMDQPIYPYLSNNATLPLDTKYPELTDISRTCLNQEVDHHHQQQQHHHSFSNLHNLSSQHPELHKNSTDVSGCGVNVMNASSTGTGETGRRGEAPSVVCGGVGSIRGNTADDLFLRNTNDLDEYLQLPSLICKAEESNNNFGGRRDSCTMTAEILSTLAGVQGRRRITWIEKCIPILHQAVEYRTMEVFTLLILWGQQERSKYTEWS
ncbi:unnamed protein product [Heterobilharzia americana]|nr:unnamed protein product [Heterobilharzia americana]